MSPFVIPGLIRNPVLFQSVTVLDAGSVIPDLIRDRHDRQNLSAFLNYDTVWQAGIQQHFLSGSPLAREQWLDARLDGHNAKNSPTPQLFSTPEVLSQ